MSEQEINGGPCLYEEVDAGDMGLELHDGCLLHPDLTYAMNGAMMAVHAELGPGWDERDYHVAAIAELTARGLEVESKLRGDLRHRGVRTHRFELDLLVEGKVIAELKHLSGSFARPHFSQVINYLAFWGKDLGILYNFGLQRLGYRRVPLLPTCAPSVLQDVACRSLSKAEREVYDLVANAVRSVVDGHGVRYSVRCLKGLFRAEVNFQDLQCTVPAARLTYRSVELGRREVPAFLINGRCLTVISGGPADCSARDRARLQAYLNHLQLQFGVLAHFGREGVRLQITRPPHP